MVINYNILTGVHVKFPITLSNSPKLTNTLIMSAAMLLFSACSHNTNTTVASNPPVLSKANIYINQVAFELTGPKQAVIGLPSTLNATNFTIYQGDKLVFQSRLIPHKEFIEWGAGTRYFTADFTPLSVTGDFYLQVKTNQQVVKSSGFTISDNAYFKLTAKELIHYFKANRHTGAEDKSIRINGTDRFVDVSGGWVDAGGDPGKYLSHLTYSNFLVPQQGAIAAWSLARSYQQLTKLYHDKNLEKELIEEVVWGADYLHRILDQQGFFYTNVFDKWGSADERLVTSYVGLDGEYTTDYQAAFREGAGIAIAALVRAYELSSSTGITGEFSPTQYLDDAERGFQHLQKNNIHYLDDGKENIIDDYTALIAATELYRVTRKNHYLRAAQTRAKNLNNRMTKQGWFISNDGDRPYYHGVEAGLPIIALVDYLTIEPNKRIQKTTKATIKSALDYQLSLNKKVANPFNLARQRFQTYKDGKYGKHTDGFFMPHANETNYWWQGESARMASLTAAAIWGGKISHPDDNGAFGINAELASFAQSQIDWIMGKNPYHVSLMYGYGVNNPPHAQSAGTMVKAGISNGITGATLSSEGRGITWAEGPDENNWRWVEQWLQHSSWYLLAMTAMTE